MRMLQGDVSRLAKTHTGTAGSVNKLLERSRKVTDSMKEVKDRMDKQAMLVRRLESNHHNLLKRNHFKVLIFQEDSEIPSTVVVKDSLKSPPSQYDAESVLPAPSLTGSVEANFGTDEGLQTISLSSEEDAQAKAEAEEDAFLESLAMGPSRSFDRFKADKLKRSSLKKVESIKKAFSRQSIEKKMTKIGTKIVSHEQRDKIKKSLTPNHPKSPTSRSSSFKVSPMTFNVKKQRDSGLPPELDQMVHVEIPALGSMDGEIAPLDEGFAAEAAEALLTPPTPESIQMGLVVNGDAGSVEGADPSCDRSAGLVLPEQHEEDGEDGEEEQQGVAVNGAGDAMADVAAADVASADVAANVAANISMATISVEQAS